MNENTFCELFKTTAAKLSSGQKRKIHGFLLDEGLLRLAILCLYQMISNPGQTIDLYRTEIKDYCEKFGYSLVPGITGTFGELDKVATTLNEQMVMLRMCRELLTFKGHIPSPRRNYLFNLLQLDPESLRIVRNLPVIVRDKVYTFCEAHKMASKPGGGDFQKSIESYISSSASSMFELIYPKYSECALIIELLGYKRGFKSEQNYTWGIHQMIEMAQSDKSDDSDIEGGFLMCSERRKYNKGLNLTAVADNIEVIRLTERIKGKKVTTNENRLTPGTVKLPESLSKLSLLGGGQEGEKNEDEESIYERVDDLF